MKRSEHSQWAVRIVLMLLAGALVAGLAACGNDTTVPGGQVGGGPTQAPAAPQMAAAAGVKQLLFTWTGGSGATEFRLLQNPDGQSGFTQVGASLPGSATGTTLDVSVFRVNWAAAQYAVDACNSGGCTRSNTVSATAAMLQAIGYFKASNTDLNDAFGSVALSGDGNTLAVGAPFEDSTARGINGDQGNGLPDAGAVYVFARLGGVWVQQAYVKASNTGVGDQFGFAVALSGDGNTLAVGAFGEDSDATGINGNQNHNQAMDSGAVYVFVRSGGTWSQEAFVKASNTDPNNLFGVAVALSADGNTLAVGSHREDSGATGVNGNENDNSALSSGAVYVFTRSAATWSQQAYLKASNTDSNDAFGAHVALSADGNTLAVAAESEDSAATGVNGNQSDDSATSAGAVYVFARAAAVWTQEAYVKASNAEAADVFGAALALSGDGNTLAVGARSERSSATGINGSQSDNSASGAGAVYVFTRSGGSWMQEAYVKASNTKALNVFGGSVALSGDGNTLAIGADQESSAATGINGNQNDTSAFVAGAVYVFTRTGGVWSQQAYVKAPNTGASDRLGNTVALSADGRTLAAAAIGEASSATGINGNQADNSMSFAGAVYLF
jgi:hypothetical protein